MRFDRENLDLAVGVAGLGRWEYDPETGETFLDDNCLGLLGLSAAQAGSFIEILNIIHPEDHQALRDKLTQFSAEDEGFRLLFRVRRANGSYAWIRSLGRRIDQPGRSRMVGVSMDATAEQTLLLEREMHLAEMNHRVKNLFALVSAIVSSADRESESREDFVENLRGRIDALSRGHALMLGTDASEPVSLQHLFDQILAPAMGCQAVHLDGDEVLIPTSILTPLVLIIHEWMTNSAKYGALRHDGAVRVDWQNLGHAVHIRWREEVASYDDSSARGFGSRLLQASTQQLGAEKTRHHADGWLTIDMTVPLQG
ncbi:sensor histidine kinase [Pseudooceanicola algae]|uniref:histidine kinase n=1 Tax=Pseudooceanicola algae TaxID=1537215 RepID=A0A418SCV2_9RHOB|nr:HWE histidine kinase domain-containing protein [Pseudooceanicola algae]QPM92391.1 Blue-light-activated histidine kinase [Pseudooceanicola algae]